MTSDDELSLFLQWSNVWNLNTVYVKRAETLRLLGIRKLAVVLIGTFNLLVLFS